MRGAESGRGEGGNGRDVAFAVGAWEVEPALFRLGRNGETVRLEPKVMEVLVVLASRPSQVVSRDELQRAVWGTDFVSEDLPRRAVYELRKVFGDDPRHPEYIETIPRAGYRLIAPVGSLAPSEPAAALEAAAPAQQARQPAPPSAATPVEAPPPSPRWRRLAPGIATGLLAVVLLAAALSFGLRRSSLAPPSPGFEVSPLTTQPGLEYEPSFSPDGSRVAFLSMPGYERGAEITLHVQLVGEARSLKVLEEPADFEHPVDSPTWSPDGTALAYRRWREPGGWAIYRVSALGGRERKVADLGRVETSGLSWSPDGRWLAVGLPSGEDGPLALFRIDAASGERQQLTDPPPTLRGDKLPAISPDGRWLAFIRNVAGEASELHVVPATGGASRPLLPERHKLADLDWSPDGRRLLVAVHDGGRHRLWSVEVATGAVRPLAELGDDTRWISVARHGDRLAIGRARWHFALRRHDLASGKATDLPGLSSTFFDEALAASPDGDQLALVSTRSGNREVWISDLDGQRPAQLTSFGGATVGHPRWRADGRSIVFHADAGGRFDLWAVATDGTAPHRLTGPPGNHRVPSVSRSGDVVYFASDRSGEWQVWRLPSGGGPPSQVTRQGGYFAQESPDGRWLYFTRWQTHGLWRLATDGGEEEQVLGDELRSWEWGNWAVAPEGVYFVHRNGDGDMELALYSPERGEITRRLPLAGDPVQPSLTLLPSGDAAILAELDRVDSDLLLVEGLSGEGD